MKKVFLAVLAAGLFFACGNDTKKDNKKENGENKDAKATDQVDKTNGADAEGTKQMDNTDNNTQANQTAPEQKNDVAQDIEAAGDAATNVINAGAKAAQRGN